MTRRTSRVAYNIIQASGLLSKRRWEAYDALFHHGPATASELAAHVTMRKNDLSSRLSELVDWGVAYEVRERPCRVTYQTVIEFDVTSDLPVKPLREPSASDRLRRRIAELEIEVAQLKARLARMARTPV